MHPRNRRRKADAEKGEEADAEDEAENEYHSAEEEPFSQENIEVFLPPQRPFTEKEQEAQDIADARIQFFSEGAWSNNSQSCPNPSEPHSNTVMCDPQGRTEPISQDVDPDLQIAGSEERDQNRFQNLMNGFCQLSSMGTDLVEPGSSPVPSTGGYQAAKRYLTKNGEELIQSDYTLGSGKWH
jgi:hypothetical protein